MRRHLFLRHPLAIVVPLLLSLPARAALPPGYSGKSVHVVFDGHGTWSQTDTYFSASADVTWHAVYELPVPLLDDTMNAEPGTTVTGTSSQHAHPPGVDPIDCDGDIVVSTSHGFGSPAVAQTPFIGFVGGGNGIVHAWIDTYGGYDYRTCDGEYNILTGGFPGNPPDYPTYTSRLGTAKFDIDLNEWTQQPAHTGRIQLSDSGTGTIGSTNFATASWSGTVTLSNENPEQQARIAGVDFGESGDGADPVPGTPVVADRPLSEAQVATGLDGSPQPDFFKDAILLEANIDLGESCGVPAADDWIDCGSQPDGTPEKVWPVLFVRGTPLGSGARASPSLPARSGAPPSSERRPSTGPR